MTETVNRNAKNVCILVMLVINKRLTDRALVGLSFIQIKSKTDHSRDPSYLLDFHYLPSSPAAQRTREPLASPHQLWCIFREDRVRVLRGEELGGAAV